MRVAFSAAVVLALMAGVAAANDVSAASLFRDVDEATVLASGSGERSINAVHYRLLEVDLAGLRALLGQALPEGPGALDDAPVLAVPLPDGSSGRFRLVEARIMEEPLARRFPELKTYRGQGVDDPTATLVCDLTPAGFHGMILSAGGTVMLDPFLRGDDRWVASAYKRDFRPREGQAPFECGVRDEDGGGHAVTVEDAGETPVAPAGASGATLRTYRLALAATGEYTTAVCSPNPAAVACGMSAIVTSMNRVDGIYEREVAIRMVLIANNDLVVYTNGSTDPYTNNNGSTMLGQNQSNLDSVIGTANYDIGHVFSTGGGGIATLFGPCNASTKARGVTGSSYPVGDPFDVDYVAHEMGHQFGSYHCFNGTTSSCGGGNRTASSAYEPGSGSTIMAYAGICGAENLQLHSDPYFHVKSFDEIVAFSTGSGDVCAVKTATGNGAPTVNAGASYTVPMQTPFTLSGSATDPESDPLTYCWEEFDLGVAAPPNDDVAAARPIFRSFLATTSPSRTFPRLADILSGSATFGEVMSQRTRTMTFRLTARDNRAGGGGVNYASTTVNVTTGAGPFAVTQPGAGASWPAQSTRTVLWNVASTNLAPVSCANVEITLSTNGGTTFPTVLAASTPNDGSEAVTVPDSQTTTARIKVACVGNVFFDISNPNFTISAPAATLTVTKAGSGSGTVTSNPAGIACGATCAADFPLATPVELTAAPLAGSTFTGWSGEGCTGTGTCQVVMDQARNVTATLERVGGTDTPGIYRSSDRQWYLKNSNAPGAADLEFPYGDPSDLAVKGDWDGDGDDTVGIYRDGTFYLRNSNSAGPGEIVFMFGAVGDIPVAGDWDGDGIDTIGVYRSSEAAWFLRNTNAAGAPDLSFTYGLTDETPVTGDWDGDGVDTVGIFRASDRQWYLHNSNAGGNAELVFPYGDPAQDVPVVGDWDGDGDDTVGIYRAALGEWFLKNTNEAGFADINFVYGLVNEKPLAGDWNGE